MKFKGSKQAIFQSFLFNIILICILSGIGFYYLLPEFNGVVEKKSQLELMSNKYFEVKKKGLDFKSFTQLHKTMGVEKNVETNVFLSNVLKDFSQEDYESFFSSESDGDYEEFLKGKIKEAREQRQKLEETGINDSVKNILPYYTADSSLSNESLTDFKFVNHIESLLDTFRLSTGDTIGMGDLTIVDSIEQEGKGKKTQLNPMDGKFYTGVLKLSLTGKKINIINFIHYIDNVGKIRILDCEDEDKNDAECEGENKTNGDSKVIVKKASTEVVHIVDGEEVRNDFTDMSKYFIGNDDIYNALLMEVDSLSISDYPDSSDLPTPEGFSLVKLIKEGQADEKYSIEISLRFYVKGLPTYKIEEFIKKVSQKHVQLLQVTKVGVQYVSKNKNTLKGSASVASINELAKFNKYLLDIEKDIESIKKSIQKKDDIGEAYKDALELNSVFEVLSERLSKNLEAISDELYTKYKDLLNK